MNRSGKGMRGKYGRSVLKAKISTCAKPKDQDYTLYCLKEKGKTKNVGDETGSLIWVPRLKGLIQTDR